jgi:CTP synthase
VQLQDAYKSIRESLTHAAAYNHRKLILSTVLSDNLNDDNVAEMLAGQDGIVVCPGFGNRGVEGKLAALKYARENNLPCLGICMGMQAMAIEFARDVLGYEDANSTEFNELTTHNVVDMMEEQKALLNKGGTLRLGAYPCSLKPGSLAADLYSNPATIYERHRHRYEFNTRYRQEFEQAGMLCSGVNRDSDLVEIIELKGHPFFMGVQFHPEYSSTVVKPHPLFYRFIRVAIG